jgi:hypothetical protein
MTIEQVFVEGDGSRAYVLRDSGKKYLNFDLITEVPENEYSTSISAPSREGVHREAVKNAPKSANIFLLSNVQAIRQLLLHTGEVRYYHSKELKKTKK